MSDLILTPAPELADQAGSRWSRPFTVSGVRGVSGHVYVGASVKFRRHGDHDGCEMLPWETDALPVFTVWFDATSPTPGEGSLTAHGVAYAGGTYRTIPAPRDGRERPGRVDVMTRRVDNYGGPTDAVRRTLWAMSDTVRDILLTDHGRAVLVADAVSRELDRLNRERDELAAQIDAGKAFRRALRTPADVTA